MAKEKVTLNGWAIVAVLLGILFLASLAYIIVSKYKEIKVERENALMLKGYQYAIVQLIAQAELCEPINIKAGNKSIELIPTNCTRIIPMNLGNAGIPASSLFGLNSSLF